ncbi:MAG: saccharopine dehydrogenase C-terminal domain-containing protein [Chitinophagaceae bacterium]
MIHYLLSHAAEGEWQLMLADANLQLARSKVGHSPHGRAVSADITDAAARANYILQADVVISMLPPVLHQLVAQDCVRFEKHLLTASYIDSAMRGLQDAIAEKDLLFLCEMGLDPGIDHMSAMQLIDEIRANNGQITTFRSHCGGLVAPESDDNPWHYKISWNPRNIILAGKAGAHYREAGKEISVSYEELFTPDRQVNIPGLETLSWYPNRDSLSYEPLYGLQDTPTFVRTTLRHPDFMRGWKHIIELGFTDETPVYDTTGKTLGQLFREHLQQPAVQQKLQQIMDEHLQPAHPVLQALGVPPSPKEEGVVLPPSGMDADIAAHLQEAGSFWQQLLCLGITDEDTRVDKGLFSAADLLQFAAERKLSLASADKDMIVMLHELEVEAGGKVQPHASALIVKGDDSLHTAMAKTVGLPLGIAARLILNGTITRRGLCIPTTADIYEPVLQELEKNGIAFKKV